MAGSKQSTGFGNKIHSVISLPGTAPTVMVDVKGKDANVEEVLGSGNELSTAVKDAYKVLKLKGYMKSVCLVYDVSVQGFWTPGAVR